MSILDSLPEAAAFDSGGVVLHLRRIGDGTRLVLLHGGPGLDHHLLLPLAFPLSQRYEVWLPDLPGHGRSHADDAGLPDLTAVSARTSRWLEGLAPPASVLVGHSLGAWLAREALAGGRIRPRAAVLLSSPVPRGKLAAGAPRARVGNRAGKPRSRGHDLAREFLDLCAEDTERPPSPQFVEAVRRSRLRSPRGYAGLQGQLQRALHAPLRTIDPGCPVLVLTGDADSHCTPEDAERLAAATTGARLGILPGAGHFPFSTDAEPLAGAILDFLDATGART